MALSQKYEGLVLMPWFNLTEWKSVKDLIYSGDTESYQNALDRIKVWKLRSPHMSVGVEGTLALLGALLEEKKGLTNDQLGPILSMSLLRFLNICAASNDKQGTFYKTAEKNEIPSWLITLRHDIAHDPIIPSTSFLMKALHQCLEWVKKKYWDVAQMEDHIVSDDLNFKDLINDYARLNLKNFFNENIDSLIEEIKMKVGFSISAGFNRGFTTNDFIVLLEDHLIQSVTQDKIKDSSIHIVSTLVVNEIILTINYCYINGIKRIPSNFLQIWHKLLNLLYQNGTLFLLVNKLVDVTESTTYDDSMKDIASLWIAELYRGLLKTKKIKLEYDTVTSMHTEHVDKRTAKLIIKTKLGATQQFKDILTFSEFEILPMDDSALFEKRILQAPNAYTMNYLELVLKFNGNTECYIKKQLELIKKLVQFSTMYYTDPVTIYNVQDMEVLKETYCSGIEISDDEVPTKRMKFRELTESEKFPFKYYPLGSMPPNLNIC